MYQVLDQARARALGGDWESHADVFFVVNSSRAFLTHRATWALALQAAGSRVSVISCVDHVDDDLAIRALGCEFYQVDMGRESVRPRTAGIAAAQIFALLLCHRPAVVFLSATAAYVLGWPAAIFLRNSRFIRLIAGAGRALSVASATGYRARLIGIQLKAASRLRNVLTVFQTNADYGSFLQQGFARESRSYLVRGTGIDLDAWSEPDRSGIEGPARVLFASRLFREKGVYDFVEVASALKRRGAWAEFAVAGRTDKGVQSGVSLAQVLEWQDQGILTYLGHRDDMRGVYAQFDIFVFPTYHPEGTPRVLIEAAAMGLAVVCYNQQGCLEVLGGAGESVVVPEGRVDELIDEVGRVIQDRHKMRLLGRAARIRAEESFGLSNVLVFVLHLAGATPRSEDDQVEVFSAESGESWS